MSKIYILKENPPENFVLMDITPNDCVPVDIDELAKDWLNSCVTYNHVWGIYQRKMKFSEYLQERMK